LEAAEERPWALYGPAGTCALSIGSGYEQWSYARPVGERRAGESSLSAGGPVHRE